MSVSSLTNTQKVHEENRRSEAKQSTPTGLSFQEQLVQASAGFSAVIQGPDIHLRMPTENTVYSIAHAGRNNTMQELYAEYTADSTPEDPIVRVSGKSDSGPFDFTCHIKEIDPSNASYAELAALFGHLQKTGAFQSSLRVAPSVVPTGLETGDISEKRDYLSMIDRHQYDSRFGGSCQAQAAELLALYRPCASGISSQSASPLDHSAFMKENLLSSLSDFRTAVLERMKKAKENEEDQEAWDKFMEYLDAWIESLREEADARKIARAHAALTALRTEADSDRPDLADYLLEQLQNAIL